MTYQPFQPSASVVCKSTYKGRTLTTFIVSFHRYILAEFNTHRAFSKNTSSSRAVPVHKLISIARTAEVEPIHWGTNKPGMQAGAELEGEDLIRAKMTWRTARRNAINAAEALSEMGGHKQIVNRLIEPFLPVTMIVTTLDTGLQNFFDQRLHPAAAPEIQYLATAMFEAHSAFPATELSPFSWHAPFCSTTVPSPLELQAAVGRAARVSYLNHAGSYTEQQNADLALKMINSSPAHWSPFEHFARVQSTESPLSNFAYSPFHQLRHLPQITDNWRTEKCQTKN